MITIFGLDEHSVLIQIRLDSVKTELSEELVKKFQKLSGSMKLVVHEDDRRVELGVSSRQESWKRKLSRVVSSRKVRCEGCIARHIGCLFLLQSVYSLKRRDGHYESMSRGSSGMSP